MTSIKNNFPNIALFKLSWSSEIFFLIPEGNKFSSIRHIKCFTKLLCIFFVRKNRIQSDRGISKRLSLIIANLRGYILSRRRDKKVIPRAKRDAISPVTRQFRAEALNHVRMLTNVWCAPGSETVNAAIFSGGLRSEANEGRGYDFGPV